MNPGYVLTTAAEADLREITRYTRKQWGQAQARRYLAQLRHCIEQLAAERGRINDMSQLHPGLRMQRWERHFIFCVSQGSGPALIVAILHERMDIDHRLTDRLQ